MEPEAKRIKLDDPPTSDEEFSDSEEYDSDQSQEETVEEPFEKRKVARKIDDDEQSPRETLEKLLEHHRIAKKMAEVLLVLRKSLDKFRTVVDELQNSFLTIRDKDERLNSLTGDARENLFRIDEIFSGLEHENTYIHELKSHLISELKEMLNELKNDIFLSKEWKCDRKDIEIMINMLGGVLDEYEAMLNKTESFLVDFQLFYIEQVGQKCRYLKNYFEVTEEESSRQIRKHYEE